MWFNRGKSKKQKLDSESSNDDLDVLDLDSDLDEFGLTERPSRFQKPKEFSSAFRRGFYNEDNRTRLIGSLVSGALPDSYSHIYTTGIDIRNTIKEEIKKVRDENIDTLLSITERAERNLPRIKSRAPKKVYQRLEEHLRVRREELEQEISQRDAFRKGHRSSEGDESLIRDTLLDLHAASEARQVHREQEQHLRESGEKGIAEQVANRRFDFFAGSLSNIESDIARQAAFQDNVTYRFQRKSIELQYRQLFMLRDMRKLSGAGLDLQRRAFEALVQNTGLADHQKSDNAIRAFSAPHLDEVIRETGAKTDTGSRFSYSAVIKRNLTNNAVIRARQKLPDYLAHFYPQLKHNVRSNLSELLRGLDFSTASAESMADASNTIGSKATTAGMGAGDAANAVFSRFIGPRIGQLARPYLERLGGHLNGRNYQASYIINNLPSILQDFARNQSLDDGGIKGFLRGVVRANAPSYFLDNELTDGSYQTIDKPVPFNHLSQRSLVEVIPGYLSRILHEARITRTGNPDLDREVYDIVKGRFVTERSARRSIRSRIITETQRQNVHSTMDDLMGLYLGDTQLSDEAKYALRERLMRDAGTGGRFDPEAYLRGGFSESTPQETVEELGQFFRQRFEFDENNKLVVNVDNMRRLDEFAQEFHRLRDIMPDPRSAIARLHRIGSQEILRDMGIVYNEHGKDYTNFDRIWEMYRGRGTYGTTPPSSDPERPRGPQVPPRKRPDPTEPFRAQTNYYRTEETERVEQAAQFDPTQEEPEESGRQSVRRKQRDGGIDPLGRLRRLHERFKQKLSDVYDRTGRRLLLKRDILSGEYFDVNTQRIVKSLRDITGRIIDREGNTVLTDEEYKEGLFNVDDETIVSPSYDKTEEKGNWYWRWTKDYYRKLPGRLKKIAGMAPTDTLGKVLRGAGSSLMNRTVSRDAYMPGEEEPRIRASGIRQGLYTDRNGKPLRFISEFIDTVFDRNFNVVVSKEELVRLINLDGSPHPIANQPGIVGRLKRQLITNPLKRGARAYWNWTKDYYRKLPGRVLGAPGMLKRGMGRGLRGIANGVWGPVDYLGDLARGKRSLSGDIDNLAERTEGWARDKLDIGYHEGREHLQGNRRFRPSREQQWFTDEEKEVNEKSIRTPTDALLKRINQTLERAHPEEPRRGSWQQILAERDAQAEAERDKRQRGDGKYTDVFEQLKNGFSGLKSFLMGLGGMLGLGGGGGGPLPDAVIMPGGRGGPSGPRGPSPSGASKPGWIRRSAGAVKRFALPAAAMAGKGLAFAGTAVVGTLGAPVTAAVVVGAGLTAGGVYLWRRHQQTAGRLYRVRFAQYGIPPTERDMAIPVLGLEQAVEAVTTRGGPEEVVVDNGRIDLEEVFKAFGLDPRDAQDRTAFETWYMQRFLPIWIQHQKALVALDLDIPLTEIDDKLDDRLGRDFIDAIEVSNEYMAVTQSPFGIDEVLPDTRDLLRTYLDEARDHYHRESLTTMQRLRMVGPGQSQRLRESRLQADREAELRSLQATTEVERDNGEEVIRSGRLTRRRGRLYRADVAAITPIEGRLSELQQIRCHAYGLENLDGEWPGVLLTLESKIFPQLTYTDDHQAQFAGDADTLLSEVSSLLGVRWGHDRVETRKWRQWFVTRFLPVVLAYATVMHREDRSAPLAGTGRRLSRSQQLMVARAMVGAREPMNGHSIWRASNEVFPYHDGEMAELHAQRLITDMEQRAATTTRSNQDPLIYQREQRSASQESFERDARLNELRQQQAPNWSRHLNQSTRPGMPMSRSTIQTPMRPGGQAGAMGNVYGGFAEGNGGAWEDIPLPRANKDRNAAMETLRGVQEMTGVDANLLATFAQIESNFDYNVKAPTSSATGWFQFINATWKEIIAQHGAKYGIPTNLSEAELLALRTDPRINALMGAEFLKGNYNFLQRNIGREPTDTDLYLAHFLGAGGARKLLTADVNASAAQLFPRPSQSNRTVFFHDRGRGRAKTVGEIQQWADSKVAPGRVGGGNVFSHTTPEENVQASPQVDVSGVTAMQERTVVQVGPSGMPGAFRFADEDEAAATEHAAQQAATHSRIAATAPDPVQTPSGGGTVSTYTHGQQGTVPADDEVATVVRTREARQREVVETERRQREVVESSIEETRVLGSIAQRQLETQLEMRDYLREIARNFGILREEGLSTRERGTSRSSETPSNDTSRPPTTGTRTTHNTPAPINMRRD